jgi:hypothetical protein
MNRSRRFDRRDPAQLLAYLQYALDDVRLNSERSGRHLEQAITMLAEDTSIIVTDVPRNRGQN